MVKGLYAAGTNLIANKNKLDVISNNLANLQTTGFKRDDIGFESFNARLQRRVRGSYLPAELGKLGIELTKDGDEYHLSAKRGYFSFETEDGIHRSKAGRLWVDDEGYVRSIYRTASGNIDPRRGNYLLSNGERVRVTGDLVLSEDGKLNGYKIADYYRLQDLGTMSAGVKGYEVFTEFEQGTIVRTDVLTDFAIQGEGFFAVTAPNGQEYLTRFGAMTVDSDGILKTLDGSKLVGLNGPVRLENSEFAINRFGEVIQNGEIVDKIKLVDVSDKSDVYKVGLNYFKLREHMIGEVLDFTGNIFQGHIERSNVDAVTEMIKMIELNRNYESSQKVVTTIDEMLGKVASEVGRV